MRAQGERLVQFRPEALDDARPELARGAELGDLHEEIHAHRPEERQPRRKRVDAHSGAEAGAQIFDPVRERVGEFEILRRARLLHVIAGDRNRVEFRHVRRGEGENIGDDPHRGGGRVDIGVADHELFENVVLNGSRKRRHGHALFLGGDNEQRHHRQHGAVHRHRDADRIERDAGKQCAHVVNRIDRDARHANVAGDARMVRIVAAMRGEVEGDGQAFLARGQIGAIEGVRFFGGREARVLAHRPGLRDIHRRIRAPQIGREPGPVVREVEAVTVARSVKRFDLNALGRGPDWRGADADRLRWSREGHVGEVGDLAHEGAASAALLETPRRR